jgi:hypothetical protein
LGRCRIGRGSRRVPLFFREAAERSCNSGTHPTYSSGENRWCRPRNPGKPSAPRCHFNKHFVLGKPVKRRSCPGPACHCRQP